MTFFGITAKNEEQKRAMQALTNNKPFTFITGPAGGGKTLIAQAVGLEHTINDKQYRKIVYTRLQSHMGKDVGAIPGNLDEKTYPFMRPFIDNLEIMTDSPGQIMEYNLNETIYFDPIQTMRGGTQHFAYVIGDEMQNLDKMTMHGLATRIGEGSKFVLCGNFSQIDVKQLREPNLNGFYRLLKGFYDAEAHEYFDHINFTESLRHPVVGVVEEILRNHDMAPEFIELEARGNSQSSWVHYL